MAVFGYEEDTSVLLLRADPQALADGPLGLVYGVFSEKLIQL